MKTHDLTRVALMTAVLCILAPISIPIPISSVVVSLSTFALYLMAYLLKPKQALVSVGLYLLLGAAGLPVFAGYLSGIGRFIAPGGGYLIGYLLLAGISGWFIQIYAEPISQIFGMFLGTLAMYLIGTFWMSLSTGVSFVSAMPAGLLVFLPFDILKMLLAFYVGKKINLHIKN